MGVKGKSIRLVNVPITNSEATEALRELDEHYDVCPKCKGLGKRYTKKMKERIKKEEVNDATVSYEKYPEIKNIYKRLVDNNKENFSEVLKRALLTLTKNIKKCKNCDGFGFVKKEE